MTIDIEKLKRLCEQATPGPWVEDIDEDPSQVHQVKTPGDGGWRKVVHFSPRAADAAFIAAAREAVPALIARVEAAEKERDEALGKVEQMAHEVFEACEESHKCAAIASEYGVLIANAPHDGVRALGHRYEDVKGQLNKQLAHAAKMFGEAKRAYEERDTLRTALDAMTKERDDCMAGDLNKRLRAVAERETAERIAQWLETGDRDFAAPHIMGAIARRVRSGAWKGRTDER